jgi:predicted RNA-binding protein with PUA-like domain
LPEGKRSAKRPRSESFSASARAPVRADATPHAKTGYWLVKSEPVKYSWQQFAADGSTVWDGVRNHEARNNLAAMAVGDLALFYHSNEGKEVVGVARVSRTAYPDPTAQDPRWVAVDLEPVSRLARPVGLAAVKADPELRDLALIRRSRLSVVPVSAAHFAHILELGETAIPGVSPSPAPAKRASRGPREHD